MSGTEATYALRQWLVTHQLSNIRRRHEEMKLADGLSDDEALRLLLMLHDRLAGHLRSRATGLVRDDTETIGAIALQLLIQTAPVPTID